MPSFVAGPREPKMLIGKNGRLAHPVAMMMRQARGKVPVDRVVDGLAAETDRALRAALAGRRVLIAYGLIGDLLAAMRRLGVDYMASQAGWLRDRILADPQVVPLPTAAPVVDNAARLAIVLASDPRPAVVIAHSKGGLDTLAALMNPAARERCAAFIAIQSPFYGSPIADVLAAASPLRATVTGSLRLLRAGSGLGLRDLTTAARQTWMRENALQLAMLVEHIPLVCCATAVSEATVGPDRRYLALARWMERQGYGPNDGMVPVSSALLPGAQHVILGGGHRGTVSKGRGRDPIGRLRGLLKLALLETMPAQKRAG